MKILECQVWHALSLGALLYLVFYIIGSDSSILQGMFIGISTKQWIIIAISSAVIHQLYVLVCWRLELYDKSLSRWLGKNAFSLYKIGFALLILFRPISIFALGVSNSNSLELNKLTAYALSGVLLIPSIYLFYSLRKYFGVDRAFGIDHFHPEKFKDALLVKKGIFKYTSNGMYVYGFLFLWIAGFLFQSKAALLIAMFHHIYIWIHYYFTELPDMKVIYGSEES